MHKNSGVSVKYKIFYLKLTRSKIQRKILTTSRTIAPFNEVKPENIQCKAQICRKSNFASRQRSTVKPPMQKPNAFLGFTCSQCTYIKFRKHPKQVIQHFRAHHKCHTALKISEMINAVPNLKAAFK